MLIYQSYSLRVTFFVWVSLFSVIVSPLAHATDTEADWLGGTGNWTDPTKWSTNPAFPNNGTTLYAASDLNGAITLQQNITVDQFTLNVSGSQAPSLNLNSDSLTINSQFNWGNGIISGPGTINSMGVTTISGTDFLKSGTLNLSGATTLSTLVSVEGPAVINNLVGANLNVFDGAGFALNVPGSDSGHLQAFNIIFNNYGTINVSATLNSAVLYTGISNSGTININSGELSLGGSTTSSGIINVSSGATLALGTSNYNYSGTYNLTSSSSIAGAGSVDFASGGPTSIAGIYNITGTSTFGNQSVTFTAPIQNLGNNVVVDGQFANVDLGSNSPTVNNFRLEEGTVKGSGILTVNNTLEWDGGALLGPGTVNATGGVTGLLGELGTTLNCYGTSSVQVPGGQYYAPLNFTSDAALNIMQGATFNGLGLFIQGSDISGEVWGTLTNKGELDVISSSSNPTPNTAMAVFGSNVENKGTIRITNSKLDIRSATDQAGFQQDGGSTILSNGTLFGSAYTFNSGSLTGNGNIEANIINGGTIAPSGGALNIYGSVNLTLQPSSILDFSLGGTQAGISYGQIVNLNNIPGNISLGGDLKLTFANSFQTQVTSSDTFLLIVGSSAFAGEFANISSGERLETADGYGSFLVNYDGGELVLSDYMAVPEPSISFLMGTGMSFLGFFLLRRRRP